MENMVQCQSERKIRAKIKRECSAMIYPWYIRNLQMNTLLKVVDQSELP